MKSYSLIALVLLFLACNSNPTVTETETQDEAIPELSIYQLPSVWNTQNSEQIEFKDLKGETLAVVMIYTACKSACPRLVADMRAIEKNVSAANAKDIKYVLVSIDPKNDTPEKLLAFAKENEMDSSKWLFLQGTEEGVRDFANVLAVKYKQISPIDFSHSNIISVFDKQGVMQYQKEGLGLENQDVVTKIIETSRM